MNFFSKYKKAFLVMGFLAVVFILGYLLYAAFLKPAPKEAETEGAATTTRGGLPIAPSGTGQIVTSETGALPPENLPESASSAVANGGPTQTVELNKTPSFGATLSINGSDLQYYNKNDGKFYRLDKDGRLTALSDKVFHDVQKITWSPAKNKAILEYPDGANIIYNFSSDKQLTLPAHWKDFDFSPAGDKIVMKSMGLDPDNRWLAIANEDGSKARRIELLGEKDETVYPSWSPNNQSIAMYTEGVDFDRQEVYFVGLNDENFKSTLVEGRGFQQKWTPKGDRLLYSVYSSKNDLKPMLWVVGAQSDNIGAGRKSLNIETWADKCAFANDYELYCAVPENLEEGAGLFPEMAKNTADQLYKIDTRSGLKKLVALPDRRVNISNPFVSNDGYYFYFTDEATQRLHKIKLK